MLAQVRAQVKSWWRALTEQARLDGEIASEMDSHMERYAADLVAGGVEPGEAHRRARIEFGSTAGAAEECREAVGLRWPNEIARDLRYAARVLRKSPTFTAAAVATLALCIGANTAIFSVVDAVLLRPLPYPHPERLFSVARHYHGKGSEGYQTNLWGAAWEAVRDNAAYVDAAVFSDGSMGVNFASGGRVEYVKQQRVSAGFFRVLGIAPLIGREFSADEDRKGRSGRHGAELRALEARLSRRPLDCGTGGHLAGRAAHHRRRAARTLPEHRPGRPVDTAASVPIGRGRRVQLCRGGPLAFRHDVGAGQRADRSDWGAAHASVSCRMPPRACA
jgi:hypothetical protein